jgi:23S rRNA (uracil1939-C5)-methyltransferase
MRVHIGHLGAQGDGVAVTEGGPVYVPFALPGETVTVTVAGKQATLLAIENPAPERRAPVCRHFGECGGCLLQHMEESAYRAWKRNRVIEALQRRGIKAKVDLLMPGMAGTRRRLSLRARRADSDIILGFHRMQSHKLIAITECPVARPAIAAALPGLHVLAALFCATRSTFHLAVTDTVAGLDIAVTGSGPLDAVARQRVVEFALGRGFARLALEGEILVEACRPKVTFDDTAVTPPPGAFLQATTEAEAAMAAAVVAHLSPAHRMADLFAGCGTFALRLARHGAVHAVEADGASLAALDRGFRSAGGLKPVTIERRDLFRRPLTARELGRFDSLVFDPPRAGAEAQAREIARSDVRRVAAVSCNPATLARDLAIMRDGGYEIISVIPIDQFLWSPHVEVVALLEKPRTRR